MAIFEFWHNWPIDLLTEFNQSKRIDWIPLHMEKQFVTEFWMTLF